MADGRDSGQVREVIEGAAAAFGRLDGVVDVIGMARWAALGDMPQDDWDSGPRRGSPPRLPLRQIRGAGHRRRRGWKPRVRRVGRRAFERPLPRRLRGGQSRAHLAGTHRGRGTQGAAGSRQRGGTRWRGHPPAAPSQGISDPTLVASGSLIQMARTSDIAVPSPSCRATCPGTNRAMSRRRRRRPRQVAVRITQPPAPPGVGMGEADNGAASSDSSIGVW